MPTPSAAELAAGRLPLSRRSLLCGAAAALVGAALPGCAWRDQAREDVGAAFRHGVASGDPLADRVVLWTRVTPPGGGTGDAVDVAWRIARDPALRDAVSEGSTTTNGERDFTVKVDAAGLEPGSAYHYGFRAFGQDSPVGSTRTAAVGPTARLRLAVASCANLPQGFFNAYAAIARRPDLDAVVHLGDYLYEYENGRYGDGRALGRVPEPDREITSLPDYRARHAQYKRDPDLQALHARHPMLAVWDDHELANNAWRGGAENHDPAREGSWSERRAAAVRAWLEWMPVREGGGDAASGEARIWRSFRFGDLAEIALLDARLVGRDEQARPDDPVRLADPTRQLLGPEQERWLLERLGAVGDGAVAWRLLAQQVVLTPLARPGGRPNPDAWDGYAPARARLLDAIEGRGLRDVVVLSGDVHSSWGMDVPRDPFSPAGYDPATGRGSLAVELVAPAVSSAPLGSHPTLRERYTAMRESHPHVRFQDLDARGYLLVDVTPERVRAEWWFVEGVERRSAAERLGKALVVRRGTSHLDDADAPAPEGST
jgi:alkaline phosphatase D